MVTSRRSLISTGSRSIFFRESGVWFRNYDYDEVYLFDVTAFPSGKQADDQYIGIGR
ncbi:MAG: DUF2808 domain-containing protein [Trichormus sp.]